ADQLLSAATGSALVNLVSAAKLGAINPLPADGAKLRNLAATPANEGGKTRLTGTIDGAPVSSHISLRINWDDGQIQDLPLADGLASFAIDHSYSDDASQGIRHIT